MECEMGKLKNKVALITGGTVVLEQKQPDFSFKKVQKLLFQEGQKKKVLNKQKS